MNSNYYNTPYQNIYGSVSETVTNKMIRNVYLWMTAALAITGLVAYYVAGSQAILSALFSNGWTILVLFLAEIGLVIGLSAAINKISALTATFMFALYSIINGVTLSSIFLVYEIGSIATTFFVAAGTFGAMAIYGSVTKKDLTKVGNLCMMAVIGLIIATVVNLLIRSTMADMIISGVGVLVFVGLTAYDAQKIKNMLYGAEESEMTNKIAVLGALSLYLDFINLFLYLLRFFGRRKKAISQSGTVILTPYYLMNAALITLSAGIAAGLIGILIRHILKKVVRPFNGAVAKHPSPITKNLRLLGGFERQEAYYYYHTFCLGGLPLLPIGCYSRSKRNVILKGKSDFLEILSLYLRWGWFVAAISALVLIF